MAVDLYQHLSCWRVVGSCHHFDLMRHSHSLQKPVEAVSYEAMEPTQMPFGLVQNVLNPVDVTRSLGDGGLTVDAGAGGETTRRPTQISQDSAVEMC